MSVENLFDSEVKKDWEKMNSGNQSKLTSFMKNMTRGKSIVPPMVAFVGMAGGAYYLFKQKGAENGA